MIGMIIDLPNIMLYFKLFMTVKTKYQDVLEIRGTLFPETRMRIGAVQAWCTGNPQSSIP
jgi:hypothetical protein